MEGELEEGKCLLYEGYYTSTELYGKLSGVSRSVSYTISQVSTSVQQVILGIRIASFPEAWGISKCFVHVMARAKTQGTSRKRDWDYGRGVYSLGTLAAI